MIEFFNSKKVQTVTGGLLLLFVSLFSFVSPVAADHDPALVEQQENQCRQLTVRVSECIENVRRQNGLDPATGQHPANGQPVPAPEPESEREAYRPNGPICGANPGLRQCLYNPDSAICQEDRNTPECVEECQRLGETDCGTVGAGSGGNDDEAGPVCSIGPLGWVICPLVDMLSNVNDALLAMIDGLLVVRPLNISATNTDEPIYFVWNSVRNIANVLFAIVFFAVIFSQATGYGISSYGIKKMLPRLIAAAIMLNLSYYICALAIDASNIVGGGLAAIFDAAIDSIKNSGTEPVESTTWSKVLATGLLGSGVIFGVGAVGAAGGVLAALSALLPFLVIALFAALTALVVLVARQAFLILLIIIAPLAFISFVLPNTNTWFDRWRKFFTTLLIFYPLVIVIFKGSELASLILKFTSDSALVDIFALAIVFFPLFSLPFLLKFSGSVLGRLGASINNPNKGPFDAMRKRAEGYKDYRQNLGKRRMRQSDISQLGLKPGQKPTFRQRARGVYGSRVRSADRREAIHEGVKYEADRAKSQYISGELSKKDDAFRRKVAGIGVLDDGKLTIKGVEILDGTKMPDDMKKSPDKIDKTIARAMARGQQAQDKLDTEELNAGKVVVQNAQFDGKDMEKLLATGSATSISGQTLSGAFYQKAVAATLIANGQIDQLNRAVMAGTQVNPATGQTAINQDVAETIVYHMNQNYNVMKAKGIHYTDRGLKERILQAGSGGAPVTMDDLVQASMRTAPNLSAEQLASQKETSLEIIKMAQDELGRAGEAERVTALHQTAQRVLTTEEIRKGVSAQGQTIIRGL